MNIEIEKKYHINSYDTVKSEVEKLGANLISTTNDSDIYFVVPQQKPNTLYLRIRTKNNKSTLAYHEVQDDTETKEWETDVADGKTTIEIISKLGFAKDVIVDKRREKYKLDGSEILIDYVDGLGYFVEIESTSEEELDNIASKLSLGDRVSGVGYPDLLKEAKNSETTT
jgi:adenylate cyclase class 2